MKNANKKKWSEMTKKERVIRVLGLVVRLLALVSVLALTIGLWVSARRSVRPMTASALTFDSISPSLRSSVDVDSSSSRSSVDIGGGVGLGELRVCSNSGYFVIDNPLRSISSVSANLLSFETAFKSASYSSSRGFFPLGIYFYTDFQSNGGVIYTWCYLIGFNYGANGVIQYLYTSSGVDDNSDLPPSSIVVPSSTSWDTDNRSSFADYLYTLHYTTSDTDSLYLYIPLYVTSAIQDYNVTSFCEYVFGGVRPQYTTSDLGSYQQGYSAGYSSGFTSGASVSQSDAYNLGYSAGSSSGFDSGYNRGLAVSSTESYNSGFSAGQSEGYQNGYSEGLSDGQSADKDVNLDWVISSVSGLFDIKLGTGDNALTFGDIVFTMVSISIFGGVLKLFFGG